MPQNLLTSAFKGNAITDSSTITRNTTQAVPVEWNMSALAISDGNVSRECSFMKIAIEIRLHIYRYLLLASPSRAQSKREASRGVILAIDRSWHKGKRLASAFTRDKSGVNRFRIDLTPQILRTCKAVHQEATAILYGENAFHFWFGSMNSTVISYPGRNALEALCQGLYQNAAERWNDEVYGVLKYSEFAAFLLQIGQQNTASLKKLRFDVDGPWDYADAPNAGCAMQAVTQLFKYHVPSLRQVKICRDIRGCRDTRGWDGFEVGSFMPAYDILENRETESSHNNDLDYETYKGWIPKCPPAVRQEQEEVMYKAVEDMVQEITWLKQLSFAGFDEKKSVHQKMRELQASVKTRR